MRGLVKDAESPLFAVRVKGVASYLQLRENSFNLGTREVAELGDCTPGVGQGIVCMTVYCRLAMDHE